MATLKVCIDCGELAEGTRCLVCQVEVDQRRALAHGGATARGYTRAWERKAAVVRRTQPACALCGSTEDLTVDHIIPKAAGGTDERKNLRTLCRSHNSAKGARQ